MESSGLTLQLRFSPHVCYWPTRMPTNLKVARWITIAQPSSLHFLTISLECDNLRGDIHMLYSRDIDGCRLTLIFFSLICKKEVVGTVGFTVPGKIKLSLQVPKASQCTKRRSSLHMIGCVIIHFCGQFSPLLLNICASTLSIDIGHGYSVTCTIQCQSKMTWHIHFLCHT